MNCRIATRWEADKSRNWRRYYVRLELWDEVTATVAAMLGVGEARMQDRYSIWVHRSPAFEWAEIHPRITDLLRLCRVDVEVNI